MKTYLTAALSLALMLVLVSCGAAAMGNTSQPEGSAGLPETDSSHMLEDGSQEEADHSHQMVQEDNVIPHDPAGYCGNTITKISAEPRTRDEDWEVSFWGGDSVALTDLLLYLDYQEGICRCLPEFYVKTEFSEEPYGINLTEGYARHGDSQVDLTGEQIELIQDILDRNQPN